MDGMCLGFHPYFEAARSRNSNFVNINLYLSDGREFNRVENPFLMLNLR